MSQNKWLTKPWVIKMSHQFLYWFHTYQLRCFLTLVGQLLNHYLIGQTSRLTPTHYDSLTVTWLVSTNKITWILEALLWGNIKLRQNLNSKFWVKIRLRKIHASAKILQLEFESLFSKIEQLIMNHQYLSLVIWVIDYESEACIQLVCRPMSHKN